MMGVQRVTRGVAKVGGLAVGNGAPATVKGIYSGTVAVAPSSIAANTRGTVAVTIQGVSVGDVVEMMPPATLDAGLLYGGCYVSGANTVTIFLLNYTGSPVAGASLNWTYLQTKLV
jgi:hypothetical protein